MHRSSIALTKIWMRMLPVIAICFASCYQKNPPLDASLKKQFQLVDYLNLTAKSDSAAKLVHNIRAHITTSNVAICDYYCLIAAQSPNNLAKINLYADSALAFFDNDSKKTDYPDEYFKSLITKGDACLKGKQYITALNYYFKAKKVLANGGCDDGVLASKMGGIYYNQRNFALAAKYWAQAADGIGLCNETDSKLNLFYTKQGDLNNAGFSYEKAGMLDSALSYYQRDLQFINKADTENVLIKNGINSARAVIYDNLGGVNLKLGKLLIAEDYLKKCVAVQNNVDGAHIPPLIKLTELYMRTGKMNEAYDAFKESRLLLDRFFVDNPESNIKWNKLYSEYLFKQNKPGEAFTYQINYIRLRDSLDRGVSELYRLDVERELNTLQQQNELTDLQQKDRIKMTYLAGIGIIALLSVIIIILINRNLKRTQKSHRDATAYNQQLQNTLGELEHVNKNYIRVMRVMAHDLRNPISGMTGLATLLLDEDDFTEDNKHMLRLIETTGSHSMEMINELLKSGLADENEQIIKQTLDLRSLLYDSVELLQFKAQEKGQQLIFESNGEPIMADVNHEKIWRVFNNIIVNAIKFSHTGDNIKININRKEENILISIADSGVGIPETDKNNVFEMFTPAKKAGTNGEQPFGLGLSISKKIVENHNGRIWFESTEGAGTTFYIELPAAV